MTDALPQPETQVLSTLNKDGSRRWLYPRPAFGRFWRWRRALGWALIVVFVALPHLSVRGKPLVLLDVLHCEFTILGYTFLPTDTLLLALLLLTLLVGVCLVTALLGRVWCGWACPQMVYLEFVYRPIERFFDGPPHARHSPGKNIAPIRTLLKYGVFALLSLVLAHTFLAYFVGVKALAQWLFGSPFAHPIAFLVMAAVTGLMLFDFAYFREQTCIVACPYGRFQSVMLDRDSLVVSYDPRRGEPRGKLRRAAAAPRGDCVDCGMCVDTCPTGIDIRDGLQLECIACTQCIDACDRVMDRVHKPRGLIRLSSQSRIEGTAARLLRPRVILYPLLMAVFASVWIAVFMHKQTADATLLRGFGAPFVELAPGEITNQLRLKIRNRSGAPATYQTQIVDRPEARLDVLEEPLTVAPGESRTAVLRIVLPAGAFERGRCDVTLRISDGRQYRQDLTYRLLGPQSGAGGQIPMTKSQ